MSRTHWFAHRPIMTGIADGFRDLGHNATVITNEDIINGHLLTNHYDILYTSSHWMYRKALTKDIRKQLKLNGTRTVMRLDAWKSLQSFRYQFRDGFELQHDTAFKNELHSGLLADLFVSPIEQNDERMHGFTETLGVPYSTVPFAVSKRAIANVTPKYPQFAEAVFLGSNLGQKYHYIKQNWTSLASILPVSFLGQDWTLTDKLITNFQKVFQITGVDIDLSSLRTRHHVPDELSIYSNALINLNCHLPEQRIGGGDCNERTFKIAGAGSVQLVDNVSCIKTYYSDGVDLFICNTTNDWLELSMMLLNSPNLWLKMANSAHNTTFLKHTYTHRCSHMLSLLGF